MPYITYVILIEMLCAGVGKDSLPRRVYGSDVRSNSQIILKRKGYYVEISRPSCPKLLIMYGSNENHSVTSKPLKERGLFLFDVTDMCLLQVESRYLSDIMYISKNMVSFSVIKMFKETV